MTMNYRVLRWVFHQRWLTAYKPVHEWLMKRFAALADRGHQDSQELYGFLLLFKGADAASRSQGARYLMMCASVERPKVCWQLHKVFQEGNVLGFAQNAEKAKKYYQLAKAGGHPLAQEDLNF